MESTTSTQVTLQDLVNQAEAILIEGIKKYNAAEKRLDPHRGKAFEETDMEEVKNIVFTMQDVFNREIYPLFNFVIKAHEDAVGAVRTFTDFMTAIQPKPAESEAPKIITSH